MLKRLLKFFGFLIFATIGSAAWLLMSLPDTAELIASNPKTTAIRETREAEILKKGGKPHSRAEWRPLHQISPYLRHAVVLSEDDTFFQHNGFDVEMLKRALWENWERRRFAFGASTITQQLARTLYLTNSKSILRKGKEALITRLMESTLTKDRILELYLNVVEWGPQIYGAEAAAQYFFGKPALDLTADEAVALACILPSPRRWNPLKETGFMGRRKKILTNRMVRAHYIEVEVEPEPEPSPSPEPGEELPVDEIMPYGRGENEVVIE